MSTTPYYNQSTVYTCGANRGENLKAMVQTMVAMDSMLSIELVDIDEPTQYSAYIRVAGSHVGFRIYNMTGSSSYYIYIGRGYWDATGEWISDGVALGTSDNVLASNQQLCVISWGIGNCRRYIGIGNSGYSKFIGFVYGIFDTPTHTGTVVAETSFSSVSTPFQTAPVTTVAPAYVYNPESDLLESLIYTSYTPGNPALLSGVDYTLCPFQYQAYSTNLGLLNLRWGGSHKLYTLYNGSTAVTAQPGKTVTINGISVMSVGQVIYAV